MNSTIIYLLSALKSEGNDPGDFREQTFSLHVCVSQISMQKQIRGCTFSWKKHLLWIKSWLFWMMWKLFQQDLMLLAISFSTSYFYNVKKSWKQISTQLNGHIQSKFSTVVSRDHSNQFTTNHVHSTSFLFLQCFQQTVIVMTVKSQCLLLYCATFCDSDGCFLFHFWNLLQHTLHNTKQIYSAVTVVE